MENKDIHSIVSETICTFLHTGTASGYKDENNSNNKKIIKKNISDINKVQSDIDKNVYITDVFNTDERGVLKCLLMELNASSIKCVLNSDEIYIVLEGSLIAESNQNRTEAKQGEIVSALKGDCINFSTPFYAKFLRVVCSNN
ncbi:transcriptional regulator [Brachyspira sp. G79]|uniref:transcriptional regulator n=1 Tax=Brachyspira sp. G79 TaxID=1358104 RepID=UPI000BBCD998|nr:transcriptional regulator [Brachyspira sp. G79]PCG19005.1 transcriptional regulator [Brachyspira sp. G79]